MIDAILDTCMLFITGAVLHELGHYLFIKRNLKVKTHIQIGQDDDDRAEIYTSLSQEVYDHLDQSDKNNLHLSGIIFGALPYLVYFFTIEEHTHLIVWMGTAIAYIISCRTDIKEIKGYKMEI